MASDGLGALFVVIVVAGQNIRKKEEPEHKKKHDKLGKDNCPKVSPDGHVAKSVGIQTPYTREEFFHYILLCKSNN